MLLCCEPWLPPPPPPHLSCLFQPSSLTCHYSVNLSEIVTQVVTLHSCTSTTACYTKYQCFPTMSCSLSGAKWTELNTAADTGANTTSEGDNLWTSRWGSQVSLCPRAVPRVFNLCPRARLKDNRGIFRSQTRGRRTYGVGRGFARGKSQGGLQSTPRA